MNDVSVTIDDFYKKLSKSLIFFLKLMVISPLVWMSSHLLTSTQLNWALIDYANFLIHEWGHMLFLAILFFFGFLPHDISLTIHIAGGTFLQIFVPLSLGIHFILRKKLFSILFCVWWIGDNFVNISYYVADARCQCLPLASIGGGESIHDWHYLLNLTGLLNWDFFIGNILYYSGVILMLLAITLLIFVSVKSFIQKSKEI